MQVTPKGDLVLCKVADAEDKTTGGVLLPESAQKKPTSGKDDGIWCCLCLLALLESSGLRSLVSLGSDWKSKACLGTADSSNNLPCITRQRLALQLL